jgi:hypothetical protein
MCCEWWREHFIFFSLDYTLNNWAWAHLDPHRSKVSIDPNNADCTTANQWRRVVPPEEKQSKETHRRKARDLVITKLQFKSAATYFLLRAITPAPENYN